MIHCMRLFTSKGARSNTIALVSTADIKREIARGEKVKIDASRRGLGDVVPRASTCRDADDGS